MKRTKMTAIIVGVLALTIAVAGMSYAWFSSSAGNLRGSGNAAKIRLVEGAQQTIAFEKILPGETVDTGSNTVTYDGNRKAIIQIKLNTTSVSAELNGNPTTHPDWKPAYLNTDYTFTGGKYIYTPKRIKEIMKVSVTNPAGAVKFYSNKDGSAFYAIVAPTDTADILAGRVKLSFRGEFGGSFNNGSATSASRQFEQESKFSNAGLNITAVQVTKAAVKDVMGADAVNDIHDGTAPEMVTFKGLCEAETATWGLVG